MKSASSLSLRRARYSLSDPEASSERNTGRSFCPLPRMVNSPRAVLTSSRLRLTSSETRRPPEKRSSTIARSRLPARSLPDTASTSLATSSASKNATCGRAAFASSMRSGGSDSTSWRARYFRKERMAIK